MRWCRSDAVVFVAVVVASVEWFSTMRCSFFELLCAMLVVRSQGRNRCCGNGRAGSLALWAPWLQPSRGDPRLRGLRACLGGVVALWFPVRLLVLAPPVRVGSLGAQAAVSVMFLQAAPCSRLTWLLFSRVCNRGLCCFSPLLLCSS